MKLIIDIPEEIYQNAKTDMLCGSEVIVNAIKNGTPNETLTEFADRCKECGARYGRLLQQEPQTDILDKIRAEIEQEAFNDVNGSKYIFVNHINQIIDKYRQEG